jgi:15-cis-phytoene synthase
MKDLFDQVSYRTSRNTTHSYSTSFSLGIYCADEIVDTFHAYDQQSLLQEFRRDTLLAIERRISLNPILNSFQQTVHQYKIEQTLIDCFLDSMEMDLHKETHSRQSYDQYILGSAEVVGLMCLRVFTECDGELYEKLKPAAMKLGAAFQKVNFLRDLKADYKDLGRIYFPGIEMNEFTETAKQKIEREIDNDFNEAIEGIRKLPHSSRFGVYVAYVYYRKLFGKIKTLASREILNARVRISNPQKMGLLATSYVRHSFRMI